MKLKFTSFLLLGLLFSMTALAQNTGLSFNGTNTTVSTSAFVVPTSGDFTVEFWYTMSSLGSGLEEFVSQGQVGNGFYIGTNGINGDFRCGDNFQATGVTAPLQQPYLNRWHAGKVEKLLCHPNRLTPLHDDPTLELEKAAGELEPEILMIVVRSAGDLPAGRTGHQYVARSQNMRGFGIGGPPLDVRFELIQLAERSVHPLRRR